MTKYRIIHVHESVHLSNHHKQWTVYYEAYINNIFAGHYENWQDAKKELDKIAQKDVSDELETEEYYCGV